MDEPILRTLKKKCNNKKLMNFKVSPADLKMIKVMADRYARGNVSEWIRYSALNFVPTEEDLIDPF